MKQLIRCGALCLMAILLLNTAAAQGFFDNYRPLQSYGPVPEDFSIATSEKIKNAEGESRDGLTARQQKVFVEQINYTIDDLLKSGLVTYGDEVSKYIQYIGDRLTENQPDLKGQLRFYALNDNEANAFSTDQGMVFVTTGLIAQMTNEAQLAFVLAHEIVHYREEHVLDLYDYVTDNRSLSYGEKIRFFSKYSRDNEFEADKMGVALYHAAGYASSEIARTFDVLIYSYLPFEEIPFARDYFNTDRLFVPEQLFAGRKNEISARQRYDDRYTSHPNVAKRLEALEKEIAQYKDWGTVLNYPNYSFSHVRNICRFEYLLNQVYANETAEGLYSIFLLEHEFKGSRFLNLCKAQLWLEKMKEPKRPRNPLNPYYIVHNVSERRHYEGELSRLGDFIGQLSAEGKVAMGLRTIHDIYVQDTTDKLYGRIWKKAMELAAGNSDFDLHHFSDKTFAQIIAEIEEQRAIQQNDSLRSESSHWDKYEVIRNKRSGITLEGGIDSSKFYLYGLSDLVTDSLFRSEFAQFKERAKEKEREEEDFFALTDAEQWDVEEEKYASRLHLGADTVLFVNPIVTEVRKFGRVDFRKSDRLEETLLGAVQTVSRDLGIVIKNLDRTHLESMTTEEYNDIALIMRSMEKGVETSEPDVFLMDLERLDSLKTVYGSSRVMFLTLRHSYDDHIGLGNAILYTVLFPIGMVYFPVALLTAHTTMMNVYVLDLEKGEIIVNESYFSNDPASKKMLEARCYALFNQLKETAHE